MATTANYQWFFLSAGRGVPQHVIAADPGFWVREQTAQLIDAGASIEPEVMEDYIRCFRDPRGIAAVCADFHASPGTTWLTTRRASPPVRRWSARSSCYGHALPTGHFVPEEAPEPGR